MVAVVVAAGMVVAVAIGVVVGFINIPRVGVDPMIVAVSMETSIGLEEGDNPLDDFFESFF